MLAMTQHEWASEFVSVPRRTLVMEDAPPESGVDAKTVMEPEEWIRARDQIALVVRSTIAEALLPLQQVVASIAHHVYHSSPPIAPSAMARLGELAARLRRQQGISVSTTQLAAIILEQAAEEVDDDVAAELVRRAMR
jgi:hypothetical protein